MPKPLPGAFRVLHGRPQHRHHQRNSLLTSQDFAASTWNAVIHFSARHLFCPAHAVTKPITPFHSALVQQTRHRTRALHQKQQTSHASTRLSPVRGRFNIGSLMRTSDRVPFLSITPHGSAVKRATTSAATTPLDSHFPYSSSAYPSPQRPLSPRRSDPTHQEPTSTPRPLKPTKPPRSTHTSQDATSWHFPDPGASRSLQPLEPVRTWPSTCKALSNFYEALGKTRSSSHEVASWALRSALVHYNYLSRLQSMYDIVLMARRDTRTLFLLQGREAKTQENLEQLLRIACDLIWLNEKDRQRRRLLSEGQKQPQSYQRRNGESHGLRVSEYTVLMNWIGSITQPRREKVRQKRATSSGSLTTTAISTISTAGTLAPGNVSDQRSMVRDQRRLSPEQQQLRGHVDRAWAIWQDFLLTGMKPDVVMYTSLMDALLKVQDFERADQIWNHMHHTSSGPLPDAGRKATFLLKEGSKSGKSTRDSEAGSQAAMEVFPNAQTFSVLMKAHVANRDLEGVARTFRELADSNVVTHRTTRFNQAAGNLDRHDHHLFASSGPSSLPLPSAIVSAVTSPVASIPTRTTPFSNGGSATAGNTILLNQILTVLIHLGESKAAREVFAKMTSTTPPQERYDGEDVAVKGFGHVGVHDQEFVSAGTRSSASSVITTRWPRHHQMHQRRSTWKSKAVPTTTGADSSFDRLSEAGLDGESSRTTVFSSSSSCSSSSAMFSTGSMQADKTTMSLMLKLARRDQDQELEDQILQALENC